MEVVAKRELWKWKKAKHMKIESIISIYTSNGLSPLYHVILIKVSKMLVQRAPFTECHIYNLFYGTIVSRYNKREIITFMIGSRR